MPTPHPLSHARPPQPRSDDEQFRSDNAKPEEPATQEAAGSKQSGEANSAEGLSTLIADHKGKLAAGAAAMLGLAVFYKWRESKLAKEDPEELARLKRLKAAVETDRHQPIPGARTGKDKESP